MPDRQQQQNAQRKGPKRDKKTRPAQASGASGGREEAIKGRQEQQGRQQ